MRKNFGAQPYLYPLPVLIIGTYDENGNPNAMNAAWGTVCDINKISLYLTASHKTVKNLLKTGAFTVSMADAKNVVPADYVGIVSGNKVTNKVKNAGWSVTKSSFVNAPIINELPLTLECKVLSYDKESENLIGEIVNVSVEENVLDNKGNIDLDKFHPLAYDSANHGYYTLGQKIGDAFNVGKNV